jgi:hypothetical protein
LGCDRGHVPLCAHECRFPVPMSVRPMLMRPWRYGAEPVDALVAGMGEFGAAAATQR